MIVGLGNDIVNIERIKNTPDYLQHFAARILGVAEQAEIRQSGADKDARFRELLAKYYAAVGVYRCFTVSVVLHVQLFCGCVQT